MSLCLTIRLQKTILSSKNKFNLSYKNTKNIRNLLDSYIKK